MTGWSGNWISFLTERADPLMRTAVLLTGSREAGQDLLQTALERLLRHWRTLDGDPEAYLRRTLYNLAADGFRRQGRLQRKLLLLRAEPAGPVDPTAAVDLRDALVRMLLQLPPRQRAVLVLRYWEQLTEAETAAVLGWPEGTVKSAASRGLRRLRELASGWQQPEAELAQAKLRGHEHEHRRVRNCSAMAWSGSPRRCGPRPGWPARPGGFTGGGAPPAPRWPAGPLPSPPRRWPCIVAAPAQTGRRRAQARTVAYVTSRVEIALASENLVYAARYAEHIGGSTITWATWAHGSRGQFVEFAGSRWCTSSGEHAPTAADPVSPWRREPPWSTGSSPSVYVTYYNRSAACRCRCPRRPARARRQPRSRWAAPRSATSRWPAFIAATLACGPRS